MAAQYLLLALAYVAVVRFRSAPLKSMDAILRLHVLLLASASVYGSVPPADYLLGKYDFATNGLFSTVESFDVPLGNPNETLYIRKEAGTALSNMIQEFTSLTGISVPVYGAASNISMVTENWNLHFYDSYTPLTCNNTLERCLNLLEVFPMPGTSRHAWGTEVDLFSPDQRNSDFDSGNGSIWWAWMAANASKYGFYEPYDDSRCAGYPLQKWHWSYKSLAATMLKDWNRYYGNSVCNFVYALNFTGVEACGYLGPVYAKTINPDAAPDWNAPPTAWPVLAIIVVFILAACFAIVTVLFLVLLVRAPRRNAAMMPDPKGGPPYLPVVEKPSIN